MHKAGVLASAFQVLFTRKGDDFFGFAAKDANSTEKTGWILEAVRWDTLDDHPFMVESQVTWADDDEPWLRITIKDAVFNVDVSDYIRQRGL